MLKTGEISEWLGNITNPTHALITETNNAIYKDSLVTIQKSNIEKALKKTSECHYATVQKYGETKELSAIEDLCKNLNLKGAKYFIVIISQNGSLTLDKINKMSDIVNKYTDSNTQIIIGDYTENRLWDDIKITGMVLK